ncbi:MAG: hypothetical protein JNJ89_04600 [Rubrivivax sp.]|nr:hypothetical protein [Rubrivivax sp.]
MIVIELRLGWRLGDDGSSVLSSTGRSLSLDLPQGVTLSQAVPMAGSVPGGAPTADLLRFLHLKLPLGEPVAKWLVRVKAWDFVAAAHVSPGPALP